MTVNQRVAGSSPAGGAKENQTLTEFFCKCFFIPTPTLRLLFLTYSFLLFSFPIGLF